MSEVTLHLNNLSFLQKCALVHVPPWIYKDMTGIWKLPLACLLQYIAFKFVESSDQVHISGGRREYWAETSLPLSFNCLLLLAHFLSLNLSLTLSPSLHSLLSLSMVMIIVTINIYLCIISPKFFPNEHLKEPKQGKASGCNTADQWS